ncbi:MAG: element excision factor XisI family protein [Chloroflexota bacterium]|nr:element excision factor XisI family protein [Chloroflexota bacterium]
MDTLENAIKDVIGWYGSGGGLQNEAFTFFDDTQKAYSVNIINTSPRIHIPASIVVMAHIEGEYVVIDADNTDRPLVDKLVAAGVLRDKIIRGYAGERVPTPASAAE